MQGKFKPTNPEKYLGDPTNIVYRSSYEFKLMMRLDSSKDVLKWASEELAIPYRSPVDNRIHRYFPDFFVKSINTQTKQIEESLIEVKPDYQRNPPERKVLKEMTKKKARTYIKEILTYKINNAKWTAAEKFCEQRGWKFKIMGEKELGIGR